MNYFNEIDLLDNYLNLDLHLEENVLEVTTTFYEQQHCLILILKINHLSELRNHM